MPGPGKSIPISAVTESTMKKLAWLLATPLLVSNVLAADLMQVYRDAIENDPTFSAARSTLDAGREKRPQALAGLLPSLTLSGNTVWNENEITLHNGASLGKPHFNSNGYNLSLSQPCFAGKTGSVMTSPSSRLCSRSQFRASSPGLDPAGCPGLF